MALGSVHGTHTHRHTCILWSISLLLRAAYCGCGESQNNRFFPLCHPGLQPHYTDWSIQSNLAHNTKDPRSVCVCVCMCVPEWVLLQQKVIFHSQHLSGDPYFHSLSYIIKLFITFFFRLWSTSFTNRSKFLNTLGTRLFYEACCCKTASSLTVYGQ